MSIIYVPKDCDIRKRLIDEIAAEALRNVDEWMEACEANGIDPADCDFWITLTEPRKLMRVT